MDWMPMCGQTWVAAAASFVGMWTVMMAAMMLPSLTPVLWRYGLALQQGHEVPVSRLIALASAGYFFVWILLGAGVFALGAALAQAITRMPMLARAVPVSAAMVVLLAGAFQFTACKARALAYCSPQSPHDLGNTPAGPSAAWRYGRRLGLQCSRACAGLTAILLVIGVMDLRAMALVAAAISAERLAPSGERVARAVGAAAIVAGGCLMARAAWPT
jgi:predicted metal-binding membrane protein